VFAAAGWAVAVALGVGNPELEVGVGTAAPAGLELAIAVGAGEAAAAPWACAKQVRADPKIIHTAAATVRYFNLCCPRIE
jgi:hypothetical protein